MELRTKAMMILGQGSTFIIELPLDREGDEQ